MDEKTYSRSLHRSSLVLTTAKARLASPVEKGRGRRTLYADSHLVKTAVNDLWELDRGTILTV